MNENVHILVVDDNQENLKVVSNYLREKGYKIALALDGKSAINILESNKIDLILLDIMMPEMDGFEVCKVIKAKNKINEIPIIFLTARTDTDDIVKGFQTGGVDYITKPFNREELLIRVNNHIELFFAKKKIEEQKRVLIDTIKTRDQIYSVIAHDIRGPFSNIMFLISTINDGNLVPGSDNFNEILKLIHNSGKETLTLLETLLDWTKSQTDRLDIKKENVPIKDIVEECIALLNNKLIEKNIAVDYDKSKKITAYADRIMINTIIRNLLANAVKFTPKNGKISIHASSSKETTTIKISDTGIGIEEEEIKNILDDSNKKISKTGTADETGTGFGLVVVKDFIKLNNGNLMIESISGKGSTFTINFPNKFNK